MSDLMNLFAESGRNIIGDDSSPALTLENISSGQALQLQNAGGTGVALSVVSTPTTSVMVRGAAGGLDIQTTGIAGTFKSTATLNQVLDISSTVLGGATIAPVRITASTASQAFFDFRGAVISTASINLAANTMAGVIQVWINGQGGPAIGYLPIFKGVV